MASSTPVPIGQNSAGKTVYQYTDTSGNQRRTTTPPTMSAPKYYEMNPDGSKGKEVTTPAGYNTTYQNTLTGQTTVTNSSGQIISQTSGSYSGGGGGGISEPQSLSVSKMSQAEIQAKAVAEEKARKKAFTITGGLVMPGQVSSYFKTSANDIQTDSQAIRTATNAADQITKEKVAQPIQTKMQSSFLGEGLRMVGVNFDPFSEEVTSEGAKVVSVNGTRYAIQGTNKAVNVSTGKQASEAEAKQVFSQYVREKSGSLVMGSSVGVSSGAKIVSPSVKAASKFFEPVTVATSKAIGNVADDVFRMLSPATQQTVTRIAQKEVVQKGIQTGGLLIKTEATGEAFRQAGTAAPDIVSGTYLFATPGRVFTPTPETKKAAEKTYTATRVSYYGGERQTVNDQGVVIKTEKVPGKSSMGESFAEGYLPGIKVATPFAQEFEVQTKEKVQDIPEYKALKTDAEKRQYEKEFKDFYLNVQQIGGTVGQVLIETGGEVSGGGRLAAISGGGIKTRAGAIGRFALASGTAGIQEGVSTSELQAKVEQRTLSEQDRLNSALLGGAFAGGFGALQAGTMGTKWNRGVNISGQLLDYPGEPLGDVLGGQVKKVLKVPDIKVGGQLVKTTFGPSITSQTDVKRGKTKQPQKQDVMNFFFGDTSLTQQERNRKAFGLPIKTSTQSKSNIVLPGTNVPVGDKDTVGTDKPGIPPVDSKLPDKTDGETTDEQKDEQKDETEQKQDVATNVPSFANVPSTVPVIAPQGFFFPGFFPVGSGGKQDARERTKIYDEMAAAGKRFEQLSGLPFTQRQSVKRRKTVMINGKEFRIGKRVKKE